MKRIIMDSAAVTRSIGKMAHQIVERNEGAENLAIVGILTRGVDIAKRISKKIIEIEGVAPAFGHVDITLYRDDFRELLDVPQAKGSELQFDVTGKDIVLIDDVLYTGRTIRSAIDVILDFGRPKSIQLAVLVDRGGRELPICPDYIGKRIEVRHNEYVNVRTKETDRKDEVILVRRAK